MITIYTIWLLFGLFDSLRTRSIAIRHDIWITRFWMMFIVNVFLGPIAIILSMAIFDEEDTKFYWGIK